MLSLSPEKEPNRHSAMASRKYSPRDAAAAEPHRDPSRSWAPQVAQRRSRATENGKSHLSARESRERVGGSSGRHRSQLLPQDEQTALEDIESLLVSSGVAPSQVLMERRPRRDEGDRITAAASQGSVQYRDPNLEVPRSLAMLEEGVSAGNAQLQQGHYIWRLEQEIADLTAQHSATCELLLAVTFRKDTNALLLRESEERQGVVQDMEETFAHVKSFFYERKAILREALWRSRLEREAVRAAVAEERQLAAEREVGEERARSRVAAAEVAALHRQLDDAGAREVTSLVRSLLTESNEKVAQFLGSVPGLVRAALQTEGELSSRASSQAPTAAPPVSGPVLQEELRAVVAAVMQEQLAELRNKSTLSSPTLSTTKQPSSPAIGGSNGASVLGPSSIAMQHLLAQHQALLFTKVTHVLDHIEDMFLRAAYEKAVMVTNALVAQSAAHDRAREGTWHGALQERREEVKALREQVLSLRAQKQQLLQSFHERADSHSQYGGDGNALSVSPQTASQAREASLASLPGTVASYQSKTGNPAYDPYCAPYIPPFLKAAKPPQKQSLKKLTEEALSAGARPAADLLPSPVERLTATTEPATYGTDTRPVASPKAHNRHQATNNKHMSSSEDSSEEDTAAVATALDDGKPLSAGAAGVGPRALPGGALEDSSSVVVPPIAGGVASLRNSCTVGTFTLKSFRPAASLSTSSSSSTDDTATEQSVTKHSPDAERPNAKDRVSPAKAAVAANVVVQVQKVPEFGDDVTTTNTDASAANKPKIIESVMASKAKEEGKKATPVVKTLFQSHAFDESSSSSPTSPSSPAPAAKKDTASEKVAELPASTRVAAPAAATAVANVVPVPAKRGLQSVSALFPTTTTTVVPSAAAAPGLQKVKQVRRDSSDDDDDSSLTLTLSTSNDDKDKTPSAGVKKASLPKKMTESAAQDPLSAKGDVEGSAVIMKRSTFDDDDDDKVEEEKPKKVNVSTVAVAKPVSVAVASSSVRAPDEKKRTVSLPW